MRIAITGANGFLGRALVDAALDAGHTVRALIRPQRTPPAGWRRRDGIETCAVALAHTPELVAALTDADAVIHAAAAKSGDAAFQYAHTVATTQALLAALREAGTRRLVGVGSFAVFDYPALTPGALLDERAPRLDPDATADPYARAKRIQEQCLLDFDGDVTVLHPGIVYGPDMLWQFPLGRPLGDRAWLRIGPAADELPWIHVDNCAQAIVAAVDAPAAAGAILNLVDDERPGRDASIARLNAAPALRRRVIRLPWPLLAGGAAAAGRLEGWLGRTLKRPVLLQSNVLDARFKPLRYSNAQAKQTLGWRPSSSFDDAIAASTGTVS